MTIKISPKEWEALSAYLDGQLASKEVTHLRNRLEKNPDLRSALDDLRRTRAILHSQPRMRAPRNFILTPEMAGIRPGASQLPGAYPYLRLASVLAAIFFVVVFIGDLAVRTMQPIYMIGVQAPQEEVAPPVWPAVGMGGGGGGDASPEARFAAPVEEVTVIVEKEVIVEAEVIEGTPDAPERMGDAPAEKSAAEGIIVTPLAALSAATPTPVGTPSQDLNVLAPEEAPAPVQAPGEGYQATPARVERAPERLGGSILGILEALLVLLAIGAGLGAFYLRRSARR